jgi:hypothetical protein
VLTVRISVGVLALVAITTGSAHVAPAVVYASSSTPSFVLDLRLTTIRALPPISAAALMAETSAIWRKSHILLRWVDADATDDKPTSLRVLILARVVPPAGERSAWTVGELVRTGDSRALAIASITGALRIVEESRRFELFDLPALHDRRLGVVLGRAVAHEIGHYLLQTNTHAARGLMRATIDAREFADLRSGTFRLDEEAEAHLATIAERGLLVPEPEASRFSYAVR